MYCKNCGNMLNAGKYYCNNFCQKEYEYRKYIDSWKKVCRMV